MGFIENVNTLANAVDVGLVAALDDIAAVSSNITDVVTVSTNITNINSVVTTIVPNIAEILQADTNAAIATTKAAEALVSSNNAHASEIAAGISEVNAAASAVVAQNMIDDTAISTLKTFSSSKTQSLHDIQAEAIANLATAQCHITQSSIPALVLTTTHNVLPFSIHVDSTDTNIMTVDDVNNTITFKKNASFNFLSHVLFSSTTGLARTITFELINVSGGEVLVAESNVIDIPNGTTEGIALNTLITVGKNGIPSAPLTMRIQAYSTGTGHTVQSFNSILASSSAYNVSTEASGISAIPTGNLAATNVQAALAELDTEKIAVSTRGVANGVATLDVSGLVPSSQLPSYVDDILEYATKAALPATGEVGKIYIVVADETAGGDTSSYRWTGSIYAMVSNSLTAADILALVKTVDGAGSGLDADLLDGQSGAYYAVASTSQPLDATLTALAGVVTATDKLVYATGVDTFTTATLTATARTLLDDSDVATMRTTLGISATNTPSTAVGGVVATNVQAAIQELDNEKVDKSIVVTSAITSVTFNADGSLTIVTP